MLILEDIYGFLAYLGNVDISGLLFYLVLAWLGFSALFMAIMVVKYLRCRRIKERKARLRAA